MIAAVRSLEKAEQFSAETQRKVLPMALDVARVDENDEALNQVMLVVMCLDQIDIRFIFVEECIRRGIHYIDISASYELLSRIEMLHGKAQGHQATILLSVGLAPGLTNLLASYCKSALTQVQRADIFILLGLGEAHSEAAIRWTLENLNAKFVIDETPGLTIASSFAEGRVFEFPEPNRRRMAYRFNFANQHVIVKTLGIESAPTWLCFDSPLLTRLIALIRKVGLSGILRMNLVQNAGVKILRLLHPGTNDFCIKVRATATTEGKNSGYECLITGRGEGHVTGLVAAYVAERFYTSSFPAGVFHIEQLFQPPDIIESLRSHGLSFYHGNTNGSLW